jgi:aminoglycoside phosphotransferase (APT) family kinase protein
VDKANITVEVVRCLIDAQFPQWSDLPVRPVPNDGWDNTSFRLGDEWLVRLPSADGYTPQVAKEQTWLPVLRRQLPFPIPEPVGHGQPGCGYPRPWSVLRWLPGTSLSETGVTDSAFVDDLAGFLRALRAVDATDGPPAGPDNFFRGADLASYDPDIVRSLRVLDGRIDPAATQRVWDNARRSLWTGSAVWLHGDIAPSNILVDDHRLAAVIDFGQAAVGDPACDLVMAWTYFNETDRQRFLDLVELDDETIDRAKGWALWKALITEAEALRSNVNPWLRSRSWGWSLSPAEVIALLCSE